MAVDNPNTSDKKTDLPAHGAATAATDTKSPVKDAPTAAASPEQLKKAVDSNVIADPVKLNTETFSLSCTSSIDWTKPASTDLSSLYCDTSIYKNTSDTSKVSGASNTLPSLVNLDTSANPLAFKAPADNTIDFSKLPAINTFTNSEYASNFWNADYSVKFDSAADRAMTSIFADRDVDKPNKSGKDLDFDKSKITTTDGASKNITDTPTFKLDAALTSALASHQGGDSWTDKGTDYYKTSSGDLVQKDDKGLHYTSADGLQITTSGHGDMTMTKGNETVIKRGNDYFKKYGDGEEVQIKNEGKGKTEIAAIVRLEGMVFEERKSALAKLGKPAALTEARHEGSRTVTGADGVQIYKVDTNGDLVAKSSKEQGAFVQLKSGDSYHILNGKVFKLDAQGQPEGGAVGNDKLPPGITSNSDGSYTIGTVKITADNQYSDSDHHQHMKNMTARVDAETSKGAVSASVENGKASVKTPDHSYNYDPAAGPDGTLTVLKPDNTVDLKYNYASQVLNTDGCEFNRDGCRVGENFIGYNGSFSDNNKIVFSSVSDDGYGSSSSEAESVAESVTTDASGDVADVSGEIGNYTSDFGDVGELSDDLSSLTIAQGLNLDSSSRSNLDSQIGRVSGALSSATRQAEASALALSMTGMQNSELTKEITDAGGGANVADAVMKRWGLLPALEIYDPQAQVA